MAEQTAVAVQSVREPTTVRPAKAEGLAAHVHAVLDAISRRAYEIFEGNDRRPGRQLEDWFQAEREMLHPLHVQMSESEKALEIKAEVPGFEEKELEVSVEPRRLVIGGKRESKSQKKKGKTIYSEACSDEILRVVDLPAEVDAVKAVATLKDGILELELPKTTLAQSIKVATKAS